MSRHLKHAAVVFVVALAAAQFVRPDLANPPIDPSRTIEAHIGQGKRLSAVLDRACGECHSNATVWPWYTRVAPVSWLAVHGVREAREVVNFSEWGAYSPEQRRTLLTVSCESASAGRMPGLYSSVVPSARLSAQDVDTICAAAR